MEDWDDDAEVVEALPGSPPQDIGSGALSDFVLELVSATTKLHVLLTEADEDGVRAVRARLDLFRRLVAELPTEPRPKRSIGFRLQAPGQSSKARSSSRRKRPRRG